MRHRVPTARVQATAFTTGARRGEVSALRENRFDFTRQQVRLARNYLVKQGQHIFAAAGPRSVPRTRLRPLPTRQAASRGTLTR